jgi:hypothetical protein
MAKKMKKWAVSRLRMKYCIEAGRKEGEWGVYSEKAGPSSRAA